MTEGCIEGNLQAQQRRLARPRITAKNARKDRNSKNTKDHSKLKTPLPRSFTRTDSKTTVFRASSRCPRPGILWLHQSPRQACHSWHVRPIPSAKKSYCSPSNPKKREVYRAYALRPKPSAEGPPRRAKSAGVLSIFQQKEETGKMRPENLHSTQFVAKNQDRVLTNYLSWLPTYERILICASITTAEAPAPPEPYEHRDVAAGVS